MEKKKVSSGKIARTILFTIGGILIFIELFSIIGSLITTGTSGISLGSTNSVANFTYAMGSLAYGIVGAVLVLIGVSIHK